MIVDIYKINFEEVNTKTRVYNYCLDCFIKAKKLETKSILIRYDDGKSIRIVSLHYHELMRERFKNMMEILLDG